jgi:hypothetical protein
MIAAKPKARVSAVMNFLPEGIVGSLIYRPDGRFNATEARTG